ncbi:hypothetical protein JCM19239_248 [Vibrio variabilis]|uniref:Uncharacterized protein n=1 Tax=Vibrio variabilis TaxID=990271 RepID=A0ABQ0JQY1_9VIBR|nr:hypothetical protein JCM19239_248 [Vibrio variabilis]
MRRDATRQTSSPTRPLKAYYLKQLGNAKSQLQANALLQLAKTCQFFD